LQASLEGTEAAALATGETVSAAAEPPRKKKKRSRPALRFGIGERVVCNISKKRSGALWKRGTVLDHWHKIGRTFVPYVVQLDSSTGDDGPACAAPADDDECIRLESRATIDPDIMRPFAVPLAERGSTTLRFQEGDRVAVQLDTGHWEEGGIIEVWAVAEQDGRPMRGWEELAVPYAVRLDLSEDVMVPFDSDTVILPERAARPPQRSVEEMIGGKSRKPQAAAARPRFTKTKNEAGAWVLMDSVTGAVRPCAPPSDDSDNSG